MPVRCDCGRFAAFDAYYDRWWCDRCERRVAIPCKADGCVLGSGHAPSPHRAANGYEWASFTPGAVVKMKEDLSAPA
jgi:hypothetical protein